MNVRWTKSKVFGFTRYTDPSGRVVLMETFVREAVGAGFGHARHVRTRRVWRVYVDGEHVVFEVPGYETPLPLMIDAFDTLRDAKLVGLSVLTGR